MPIGRGVRETFQTGTGLTRWSPNGIEVAIDVNVQFELVGYCPAVDGYWQCEPADREPPRRTHYEFQFVGAAVDNPDEPPLSQAEMRDLASWFDKRHDTITEDAADTLRGMDL